MAHAKKKLRNDVESVWVGKTELIHPDHVEFVRACRKQGRKVRMYHGRFAYIGPSIKVTRLDDMSALDVAIELDWDCDGLEFIVHPKTSANEFSQQRRKCLELLERYPLLTKIFKGQWSPDDPLNLC